MLQGVIQRLRIIYQSETLLTLRELPLLDWAVAFGLIIIALIIALAGFWATALIAGGIGIYFVFQGRVRLIHFDVPANSMCIHYQRLLSKKIVSEINLNEIRRAYLFQGDDGGTQIILVRTDAEELGMSVYSDDVRPWKDDIVIAINAILFTAHKYNDVF